MTTHPALTRTWLQTGGLPVDETHAAVRRLFDKTDTVEWLGNSTDFTLFNLI